MVHLFCPLKNIRTLNVAHIATPAYCVHAIKAEDQIGLNVPLNATTRIANGCKQIFFLLHHHRTTSVLHV